MPHAKRILIIEDEPNVRLVFRAALVSDDYLLSTAEDGEMALRYQRQSPADLILLDLNMPGIGGMEVLRRLRATGDGVPIVVVSARDSAENVAEAIKLGAVEFLSKPTTPAELRRVVANVLARNPVR